MLASFWPCAIIYKLIVLNLFLRLVAITYLVLTQTLYLGIACRFDFLEFVLAIPSLKRVVSRRVLDGY